MAIKRKDIRDIIGDVERSDEIVSKIMDLLHGETDGLKDQITDLQGKYDKAARDLQTMTDGKTKAEKDFADYKAEQTAAQTRTAKSEAYKAALKAAGVADKYIETVMKASTADIDALTADDAGKVTVPKTVSDGFKTTWGDFIQASGTRTEPPAMPPSGGNPKTYTMDAIKSMSAAEINANWDAVQASLKH